MDEQPPENPKTEEKPTLAEEIILHSAGPIPGLPGLHAPGSYLVNWRERTIAPVVEQESEKPDDISPIPESNL